MVNRSSSTYAANAEQRTTRCKSYDNNITISGSGSSHSSRAKKNVSEQTKASNLNFRLRWHISEYKVFIFHSFGYCLLLRFDLSPEEEEKLLENLCLRLQPVNTVTTFGNNNNKKSSWKRSCKHTRTRTHNRNIIIICMKCVYRISSTCIYNIVLITQRANAVWAHSNKLFYRVMLFICKTDAEP